MQIVGRSAASKQVVASGSSEPCDSNAVGVNKSNVRLKLTATLPLGLVDKALLSAQQATSRPQARGGATDGKPSWWGAITSVIVGGVASLMAVLTLATGTAVGASVSASAATGPPGGLSLSMEEPAAPGFRPMPDLGPAPGRFEPPVAGEPFVEKQYPMDSRELLESVKEEYGGLEGKRLRDYVEYRDSGKYSEDDMYFLKNWLKYKHITLREVEIRAEMMAKEPVDLSPFWDTVRAKAGAGLLGLPVALGASDILPPSVVVPVKVALAIKTGVDLVSSYNSAHVGLTSRPKLSEFVASYDWSPEFLKLKYEQACDEAWKAQQTIDAKESEITKVQAAEKLNSDQLDQLEQQGYVSEREAQPYVHELMKQTYITHLRGQIYGLKQQMQQLDLRTRVYKQREATGWATPGSEDGGGHGGWSD